jgi:hypothetical protein
MKNNSLVFSLPRWAVKIIEATRNNVGDIFFGCQTQSQKKHSNVDLITCILETFDHVSYLDAQG